jgi:hypothetical protein
LTLGADDYVVCLECALGYERRSRERISDGVQHLPPITGDVEARLRQLVDDW